MGKPGPDPLQLRFLGPQRIIQTLADLRQHIVSGVDPTINLAVLAFGSDTRGLLDWTEIASPNTTADQWTTTQNTLLDALSVTRFGKTRSARNRFLERFARSANLVPTCPFSPQNGGRHSRA